MSFESLQRVLTSFEAQYAQTGSQPLAQISKCWPELVGAIVAAQTRPVSIHQNILNVATSSPAWAQNLVFERQRLLVKLNARLALSLLDIRFSTAHWYDRRQNQTAKSQDEIWQHHPSQVSLRSGVAALGGQPIPADPESAFQRWAKVMQARSRHLPNCPQCHSPTPAGELERWSVCSLCASQQWHGRSSRSEASGSK